MEGDEECDWGFEVEQESPIMAIGLSANLMVGVVGMSSICLVGRVMGKEVGFSHGHGHLITSWIPLLLVALA